MQTILTSMPQIYNRDFLKKDQGTYTNINININLGFISDYFSKS